MSQPPHFPMRPPAHLPVLTEVLEEGVPVVPPVPVPVADAPPTPTWVDPASPPLPVLPEVDLSFPPPVAPVPEPVLPTQASLMADQMERAAKRVRANVQLQVDQLLEAKLREAMAPLLAQQADMLVFRLKMELAGMLDDMVARAVSQEMHRQSSE